MPLPSRDRVPEYARKGLALGGRVLGTASELRAARRLRAQTRGSHEGPSILFLSPRDWAFHNQLEGLLGLALEQRGARVQFLGCGGGLEICDRANIHEAPPMPCRSCRSYNRKSSDAFGFPLDELASWWDDDDSTWPELDRLPLTELQRVEWDGLPLGSLMAIPVRWFLLAARLDADPLGAPTYRAFLRSARRVATSLRAQLRSERPDTVVMLNGLFSFEAVARAVCEGEGIDVVTYERTHRAGALIFRRDGAANRYDLSGLWQRRLAAPLTTAEERALDEYLTSRRVKGHPLLDIWRDATTFRPSRPESGRLVALFSNVTWDSSVIGRDHCFESMHAWIDTTISAFEARPEHTLMIRVHPAEQKRSGKWTRESVAQLVSSRPGGVPENVILIGPDDPTSSYPIMEEADLGLVYTSTTGIEMACMGKPVVVAGQAHYRGLGFTNDPETPDEYVDVLGRLLRDPSSGVRSLDLARRYAHVFFFEAPIPLDLVREPHPGLVATNVTDVSRLAPGHDENLDRVCDGILGRSDDPLVRKYFLPELPVR